MACLLFGFTNVLVIDHGQTHPLVAPLGMLNLKIIRLVQLQDNLGFILKRLFISKFISEEYPSHLEFEISSQFIKK